MENKYVVNAGMEFTLTSEDVEDLVITALNGGIGYWACLDNTTSEWSDMGEDDYVDAYAAKILMDGGYLTLLDEEDEESEYSITLDSLLHGVKLFIEKGYDRYGAFTDAEVDMGNIDAEMADIIVQLAVFNDIVYG